MKRVLLLSVLALASSMAAWASGIDIVNKHGSVFISYAGIVSKGSQLHQFNGIVAPPGHALGSVSFSTGALTSGSLLTGGTFSSVGSSLLVIGKGHFGQPKGVIFQGTFVGQIKWTLISRSGQNLVFQLRGFVVGQLYNGRFVGLQTKQTIDTTVAQLGKGIGRIAGGTTRPLMPEPGTLGLIGTGLLGIAGMAWRKLVPGAPDRPNSF
jgi:hypothetical protein